MEGLLAPARYIRRSTGVKVIKDSEGKKVSRLGMETVVKEYQERLFRSSLDTVLGRMLTPCLKKHPTVHAVRSSPCGEIDA
ncbi:hypothetical protein ANCDUO_12062 [Ancylostoma duodenale]|uniref:Uncharacterized protein n=1 Tax=Ancylostoma duodenale TaxID=51022 RepID=A0A0C2D6J6_9BILA|nr:hypothetical protein ANCDUO_12062 [Ancylostoma duodenale]